MSVQRLTEVKDGAPAAGPYSLGVIAEGKFLFVSGQGPYDPTTKGLVREDIAKQTELTLQSVKRIVEAAGAGIENIVSCRVYLQPLTPETFKAMNTVYAQFFGIHKPARTTIGATLLNMDVEIDVVVAL
jgi:2-iminobutanoate/2-iminopropanoate deaminase